MPRTWPAVPLADDQEVSVKAPTYSEYLNQVDFGEHFRLPRKTRNEMVLAKALQEALKGLQLPEGYKASPGETYTVMRYPLGWTIRTPSGWTLDFPEDPEKKLAQYQRKGPTEKDLQKMRAGND